MLSVIWEIYMLLLIVGAGFDQQSYLNFEGYLTAAQAALVIVLADEVNLLFFKGSFSQFNPR